jgi:regulatory protein
VRGKTARELTESEVRDIALRYLGRREYAVQELRQKLQLRGAASSLVDTVIDDLVQTNLLSDERFTEMYVRMRVRLLFGPLKIRAELRGRGISDHLAARYLPAGEDAWFDTASQWAEKKCRGEMDYAERARVYRSLMNRGFTHEQANVALDKIARQ